MLIPLGFLQMSILLVWPNSRNEVLGWGDMGAIAEPLALEYLAGGLKLDGRICRILDLRLHPGDFSKAMQSSKPRLIGVTAFSMHVRRAIELCREAKAIDPHCKTIVGGHHATFLPEDFFDEAVDFVVSGEGVAPIRAVAREIFDGEKAQAIAGLWRNDGGGGFSSDGSSGGLSSAQIRDLPVPDRSLTLADRSSYFIDWMKPVALFRTSVGCPYRCSFCSIWRAADGRYFIREIDQVVEELRTIEEKWIFLVDDEAFINRKRMLALAAAIKSAGIEKEYFTYCRIDTLLQNEDAVRAWREIGLRRLFVGIDAISPKDLGEYNKKCSISLIEQGLQKAKDLDIEIFSQFVVNTDYNIDDFKRLIRFIEHNRIDYPSFTVLTPLPGTDMLKDFTEVIQKNENGRPNWDLFDLQNAVTKTKLPPAEFRKQYRNLYQVFKGAYAEYCEHMELMVDTNTPLIDGGVRYKRVGTTA